MQYRNFKIDEAKINEFIFYNCVNKNINDINNIFLLSEIKLSLHHLIYQNSKLLNLNKNIKFYDRCLSNDNSDYNNQEYNYKILNDILKDSNEDIFIF